MFFIFMSLITLTMYFTGNGSVLLDFADINIYTKCTILGTIFVDIYLTIGWVSKTSNDIYSLIKEFNNGK